MLSLRSETPVAWVARIEPHLADVLVDHAHCEKKAAGTAMSMIFAYVEHVDVVVPLIEIVKEELDHFHQVLALLAARGIPFLGQPQSPYGAKLSANIRKNEPLKVLDRCVVAALIEARSCERFTLLSEHLQDAELRRFYARLLESEARHFATYLRLAGIFAPESTVRARLDELSILEATISTSDSPLPRLH